MLDPKRTAHEATNTASLSRLPRRTRIIATVGGTAIAASIGLGGLAIANAQDSTTVSPDSSTSTSADPSGSATQGDGSASQGTTKGDHGPRGDRGAGQATELAQALGLDETTVANALKEVRTELRGQEQQGTPGTPPTAEQRQQREDALASALATKLGVDKAKVTDAFASIKSAQEQKATEALTAKLDSAVSAGTLTEADKASVLKAQAAGVLGGHGFGGPGGR